MISWIALPLSAAELPLYVIKDNAISGQLLGRTMQLAVLPQDVTAIAFDPSRDGMDLNWQQLDSDIPNMGFRDESFVMRVRLQNALTQAIDITVEFDFPLMDRVTLIAIPETAPPVTIQSGDHQPLAQRSIIHRNFLFPMGIAKQSHLDIYLIVKGEDAIQLPIRLWTTPEFIEHESNELLILGAYVGIMIAMFGYNFFLWATIRQRSYFFYIMYVLSVTWALASQKGLGTLYLLPDNPDTPHWVDFQVPFSVLLAGLFAMLFTYSLLRIRDHFHYIKQLMLLVIGLLCLAVLFAFVLPHRWVIYLSIGGILLSIVIVIGVAIAALQRGIPAARFYLLGWGGFLLGTVLAMLVRIDVIPSSSWAENGIYIGSSVEVILFSLGLANRFNEERRQRVKAQQDALEKERLIGIKNQKLQELELDKKQRELEQRMAELEAKKERENIMIAIAHELRTPLNVINGTLDALKLDNSHDALQEGILTLREGTARLTSQAENVILMSDLTRGLQPCYRTFLMDHLARDISIMADDLLAKKDLAFNITGLDNVPPKLRGDIYLITRMVAPLIDNACKYTHQGKVEVGFQFANDELQIRISDTGPGLPKDKLDVIYQPFAQLSTGYSRRYEGMGLGLSVASALAQALLGKLELDTSKDAGCHFVITIPVQAPAAIAAPETTSDTAHTTNQPDNNANKDNPVLIVEDNAVNAKVLAKLCSRLGYTTVIAGDGQQAVEAAKKQAFSMILMDLQMPVMDGFEATLQLRHRGIAAPIVAVSANADHGSRQRCIDVGMDDFMAKPIKKERLESLLAHYLAS